MKKDTERTGKNLTVLSLFSGAGGSDVGLHATGRYKTVACVEMSRDCCKTLRKNIRAGRLNRDCKVIEAAIGSMSPEELMATIGIKPGEIDVVVGGPPCQPYSRASGNREGDECELGKMIWRYLEIVQAVQPDMFVMENVEGFLDFPRKKQKGKRVPLAEKFAKKAMRKPGCYSVQAWMLNAADFGAPQERRRLIFMGNRLGTKIDITGTHAPPDVAEANECKPWVTLRDAIGGLKEGPDAMAAIYPKKHVRVFRMIPEGKNYKALSPARRKLARDRFGREFFGAAYRKLAWDAPSWTLTKQLGNISPGFCHPSETRPLSPAEAARIQGFPDAWVFCGEMSSVYGQVGNAVPSRLAAALGAAVATVLDESGDVVTKPSKWLGVQNLTWTKKGLVRSVITGKSSTGTDILSAEERKELKKWSAQARRSMAKFEKLGEALKHIEGEGVDKDKRLYRESYGSFEAFCLNEFDGMSRSYAYGHIAAYDAAQNVAKLATVDERPRSEGQIRPITLLEKPEDQAKAWDLAFRAARAGGGNRITARILQSVVDDMRGITSKLPKGVKPAKTAKMVGRRPYSVMEGVIALDELVRYVRDEVRDGAEYGTLGKDEAEQARIFAGALAEELETLSVVLEDPSMLEELDLEDA